MCNEQGHIVGSAIVVSTFGAILLLVCGAGADRAGQDCREQADQSAGRFVEETAFEGTGVAGVKIGDCAERVEEIMGEAEGGSEWSLRYLKSGIEVHLYDGKVFGFSFYKSFRGRLSESGIRIGDSLEDVEAAYGEIVAEREVKELTDWMLDRTLLIRRGGPARAGLAAAKLYYYDVGVYLFLDEDDRVSGFGVCRKKARCETHQEK